MFTPRSHAQVAASPGGSAGRPTRKAGRLFEPLASSAPTPVMRAGSIPALPGDPHRERRQQDDRRIEVEQRHDHRPDDPQAPDEVPRRATPRHGIEHVELVEQRGQRHREQQEGERIAQRPQRVGRAGHVDQADCDGQERARAPAETTPAPRGGG